MTIAINYSTFCYYKENEKKTQNKNKIKKHLEDLFKSYNFQRKQSKSLKKKYY